MYLDLTNKQIRILEFIKYELTQKGYPPSVREICAAVNLSSTSTVHSHLNKLEKLGYIKRDPTKPRAIEVLSNDINQDIHGLNQEIIELPVIEFLKHEKGFNETIVDNIKLPANLVIGKDNFIFKLSDNSLIEAGVLKDDYIIVDRCNVAKNGSIIIGINNNNKLILARYFKNEKDIELKFQDESNDIAFLSKNTFKLIGKIKGNFRVIK